MKVKIFVIAVSHRGAHVAARRQCRDRVTLPAISFTDLSSINFSAGGTATNANFTVIDLNSVTKKVTKEYTLTGGKAITALTGGVSSALFIFDKILLVLQPPRRALRSFFRESSHL